MLIRKFVGMSRKRKKSGIGIDLVEELCVQGRIDI